jgi:hypothetical protein
VSGSSPLSLCVRHFGALLEDGGFGQKKKKGNLFFLAAVKILSAIFG